MADKNFLTPSIAVLDKSAAGKQADIPAQAWGDNTPRSPALKKQVLDAVQQIVVVGNVKP
jgi:hypothetical protein